MGRILWRGALPRFRWARHFGDHLEGALLYLFWLLTGCMSPARASAAGRRLFRFLGPGTHKHSRVKNNLRKAFDGLDEHNLEMLARDVWENFGAVLAEYPHLSKISTGGTSLQIRQVINSAAGSILEAHRPAVYVTAHLGNWELVAALLAAKGIPLSVVYGPQGNPVLESLIQERRRSWGCRFFTKTNAVSRLVRDIRAGRSIGLLPDQRVDNGVSVPFFGLDAPTTTSPAWLSMKLGCPIVPVQVERIRDACYQVTFHAPLLTGHEPADPGRTLKATADLNALFESWIRQRPQQWLCMKRRWPETDCSHEPLAE